MAEEKSGQHPQTHGAQTHDAQTHGAQTRGDLPVGGKPPALSDEVSDAAIMKVRKAAGSIAEVIEPVQSVRQERTNR